MSEMRMSGMLCAKKKKAEFEKYSREFHVRKHSFVVSLPVSREIKSHFKTEIKLIRKCNLSVNFSLNCAQEHYTSTEICR